MSNFKLSRKTAYFGPQHKNRYSDNILCIGTCLVGLVHFLSIFTTTLSTDHFMANKDRSKGCTQETELYRIHAPVEDKTAIKYNQILNVLSLSGCCFTAMLIASYSNFRHCPVFLCADSLLIFMNQSCC